MLQIRTNNMLTVGFAKLKPAFIGHIGSASIACIIGLCISMPATANTKPTNTSCDFKDGLVAKYLGRSFDNSTYNRRNKRSVKEAQALQDEANHIVDSVLKQYAQTQDSLTCDFPDSQKQGLHFKSSQDGKFRIYTWNTYDGGSMRNYGGFIQYVDNHNDIHLHIMNEGEEEPLHGFAKSVFSETINHKPTYMLVTNGVYSTSLSGQQVQLYQIQGDKLISPKLFKTNSGLTNKIGFSYDYFSIVDTSRSRELFAYNPTSRTLKFPVVVDSQKYANGEITDRFINYKLNGKYFYRVKN